MRWYINCVFMWKMATKCLFWWRELVGNDIRKLAKIPHLNSKIHGRAPHFSFRHVLTLFHFYQHRNSSISIDTIS